MYINIIHILYKQSNNLDRNNMHTTSSAFCWFIFMARYNPVSYDGDQDIAYHIFTNKIMLNYYL